jgi:hypothetical protein
MAQSADPATVVEEIRKNFEEVERLEDEATQSQPATEIETGANATD